MNILMISNLIVGNDSQDRVDIFHILPPKTRAAIPKLKYVKSVSSNVMTGIRGIVAVGKDQFYVANTFKFREKWLRNIEWFGKFKTGAILYFNGKRIEIAVTGIGMPTGLAYDRHKRFYFGVFLFWTRRIY